MVVTGDMCCEWDGNSTAVHNVLATNVSNSSLRNIVAVVPMMMGGGGAGSTHDVELNDGQQRAGGSSELLNADRPMGGRSRSDPTLMRESLCVPCDDEAGGISSRIDSGGSVASGALSARSTEGNASTNRPREQLMPSAGDRYCFMCNIVQPRGTLHCEYCVSKQKFFILMYSEAVSFRISRNAYATRRVFLCRKRCCKVQIRGLQFSVDMLHHCTDRWLNSRSNIARSGSNSST